MLLLDLFEARRNPEHPAQQKKSFVDELEKYSDNPNAYVTFTSIDKIGLNPKNKYNTPTGIYAYPIKAMWEDIKQRPFSAFPYASDRPYAWVFEAEAFDMNEYTNDDFDRDFKKIIQFMKENGFTEKQIATIPNEGMQGAERNTPISKMWNITRRLSYVLGNSIPDVGEKYVARNATAQWNKILSKVLGYDGFVDYGEGIIHDNEPIQAVFFDKGAINVLEKINNIHPAPTHDASEEEKIKYVLDNPYNIQKIQHPSVDLINLLVKRYGRIIYSILRPSAFTDELIKNIIDKDHLIELRRGLNHSVHKNRIEIPEKLQLYAIKQDEHNIREFLNQATDKAWVMAINKDSRVLRYYDNPPEKIQLMAVKKNLRSYNYIDDPTPKVKKLYKKLYYEMSDDDLRRMHMYLVKPD